MSAGTKNELIKGAISNANINVTWLFTLNGAAGAGLMTFIGNTIDKKQQFHDWSLFSKSLTWFGIGILFALICSIIKNIALILSPQILSLFKKEETRCAKETLRRTVIYSLISLIFLSLSTLSFVMGMFRGVQAIFGDFFF